MFMLMSPTLITVRYSLSYTSLVSCVVSNLCLVIVTVVYGFFISHNPRVNYEIHICSVMLISRCPFLFLLSVCLCG